MIDPKKSVFHEPDEELDFDDEFEEYEDEDYPDEEYEE